MNFVFTLTLLIAEVLFVSSRVCKVVDDCSCTFTDTKKSISLHRIDNENGKRFQDIEQASNPNFKFDYNPCTSFSETIKGQTKCANQLVCQKYVQTGPTTDAYSVGGANTLTVPNVAKNDHVVFHYDGNSEGGATRHSEITLVCDPKAKTPTMSKPIQQTVSSSNIVFKFSITTECACEGVCATSDDPSNNSNSGGGLSLGSVLCIILLVLVVVYFVGGILFLKFYKKREGTDVIPNRSFWSDMPSKIKDGFGFTVSKIKRKDGEYEKI